MTEIKKGVLLRGIGSFYTVREDGTGHEWTLRAPKKLRRQHLTPLPGDRITFIPGEGEEHGWIEEILPRTSLCLRPPVANVETLIIVAAPVPEADLLLADRQMARAFGQGIRVLLAVNKCDLDASLAAELRAQYAGAGVSVFPVSAREGTGLAALKAAMAGRTFCCVSMKK